MFIKNRNFLTLLVFLLAMAGPLFHAPKLDDFKQEYVQEEENLPENVAIEREEQSSEEKEISEFAVGKVKGVVSTKSENGKEVEKEPVIEQEQKTVHMIEDSKHQEDTFDFISSTSTSEVSPAQVTPYSAPFNENNEKEVMGFLPYWELANYADLQFERLSTVAYFGLTANGNGGWVNDSGRTGYNSSQFTSMRNAAHSVGAKVVLVVKNFDPASIKKIVGNTGGAGDTLIENIVDAIEQKSLDGVNIDFEYVANDSNPVTTTLRENFALWHDKLADRIHDEFPGAHVSTDVFGSSPLPGTAYDLRALGRTGIDYIMMMTYDYTTTRCYDGKLMAPVSPLYGNDGWNVSYHIDLAIAQVPSGKIIMGIPYYGIDLRVKSSDRNSYNARADYPNCDGLIETYRSITDPVYDAYHNDSTIRWNNSEKARWYVYQYSGNWRQGYYDDVDSLSAKYDFVRDRKLAGIGIWALNYDRGRSELYNLIRTKFQRSPFIVAFFDGTSESRIESIFDAINLVVIDDLGNNVYRVKPNSGLSQEAIVKLKKYKDVSVADFENPRSERTIDE